MIVCSHCGKENQDHYKFCLGCGSDITARPAPVHVEPPAPARPVEREPEEVHHAPVAAGGAEPVVARPASTPQHVAAIPNVAAPAPAPAPAPVAAPPAPVMRSCPNCGHQVPLEFVFCGQCGTRLGAEPSPAKAPQPAFAHAPVPQPRGRLVLIRPDGSEGGTHPLHDGENIIGRKEGALFESDTYLSPRHAVFFFRGSALFVRDAGSLNGVFVKMTGEEEIADGEVFRMGQELLRFDVIRPPQSLEDGTEVMGSPNPGYWARVSVIIGRGQDGAAFPLFGDAMVVGRERGDILFPEDGYVSGTHARVSRREGRYYLADLNSSNGSFLRIRGERAVRTGSFLLLGQQLFRVQFV